MRIDINFYAREKSMQDMMWPRQDANIMDYGKESLYKFNLKCSGNVSENFSKFGDVF